MEADRDGIAPHGNATDQKSCFTNPLFRPLGIACWHFGLRLHAIYRAH